MRQQNSVPASTINITYDGNLMTVVVNLDMTFNIPAYVCAGIKGQCSV